MDRTLDRVVGTWTLDMFDFTADTPFNGMRKHGIEGSGNALVGFAVVACIEDV